MISKTTLTLFLLSFAFAAQAQFHGGFKTGLNFANIKGPSETDDSGASLETKNTLTGFHIGATFSYAFGDHFGARGELLYSKQGMRYSYDGQAYRIFTYSGGSTMTVGTARYRLNVNNAYLNIPILAYGRFGSLEVSGGVYAGILLQSVGDGSMQYTGNSVIPPYNSTGELAFLLDYNYRKDNPGEGNTKATIIAKVDSKTIELPKYLGAYYDYPEDRGNLYNTLDYGITAGISYYLSHSLYASIRFQYGLADVTHNNADLSKARTDQGKLIYRDDKDRNVVVQGSIGFSF